VPYSAAKMRGLVEDIPNYSQFLPWCGGTKVISRSGELTRASIRIQYRGIDAAFTTDNRNVNEGTIEMTLVDGPFRSLNGTWTFAPLDIDAAKVGLDLRYEFSNKLLEFAAGPVFHKIADDLVDAFVRRADSLFKSAP